MTDQPEREPVADPTFQPAELPVQDDEATDYTDPPDFSDPDYDEGEEDPEDTAPGTEPDDDADEPTDAPTGTEEG